MYFACVPPHSCRAAAETVQDYLKAIYALENGPAQVATTNAIADRLGVTAASASAMVKRLAARALVVHRPYHGALLTATGERIALRTIRRHRLLETFLARDLGMAWDRVHEQADLLEHRVSDELEGLIAAKLGHPTRDPHGDPIPTADLGMPESRLATLAQLPIGAQGRLVRVDDADPRMLRFLNARSIAPGQRCEVMERHPFGGPLSVRFADREHLIGGLLADAIQVEPDDLAVPDPRSTKETTDARS